MQKNKNSEKDYINQYGYFANNGKEYVITTHSTPRPWTNVISNGDYGFIISQTGGGYSWKSNAQLNRITRWEQDLIKDEWGKYIYIKDNDTNKIWSAAWKPVCAEPDFYECRHGIGYTKITSLNEGIETELLMFVAPNEPVEIINLKLKNKSSKKRNLSVFTYFEWNLGAAPDSHREFHKLFIETEFNKNLDSIFASKRLWEVPSKRGHWNKNWEYIAFHSSNKKINSFETDKESFIGMYRNQKNPIALEKDKLENNLGNWLDPIGSLKIDLKINSNESDEVIFLVGAVEEKKKAKSIIKKYKSSKKVDAALNEIIAKWENILSKQEIKTPDKSMDYIVNTWSKYQAISGRLWGRTGYYQTGGAFGFRDQLQDSQIFLPLEPEQTKKQILLHAQHQFKNGTVYHWWHPLSEIGLTTEMTDDLLWLPYLVLQYIDEVGELNILDEKEIFVDDKNKQSIFIHSTKAIDRVLLRLSKRGIPLIGAGDWNDGLSAVGLNWKGESIWLGQFLYSILINFSKICFKYNKNTIAKRYLIEAEKLKINLNKYGWDGKYYYGATKDSGEKLGSSKSKEGKIWLNTQTWGIISEIAVNSRAEKILDVIENKLETKVGPILISPAYFTPDSEIGYLTRYSPGSRENGGVYTHAATWGVIAAAKLKRSEMAYRIFSNLNPINLSKNPNEYYAEPYVTSGNIDGPQSKNFGRGGWTWYTGSATWLQKVAVEWILGIRASFNGLIVDPCIPKNWNEYEITRIFRGVTYNISIKNPQNKSFGVKEVKINGIKTNCQKENDAVVLPIPKKNKIINVEIVL